MRLRLDPRLIPPIAIAVACAAGLSAFAGSAEAKRSRHAAPDSLARPASGRAPLKTSIEALVPDRLWLGRAAMEWSTGNLPGAIENLERIPLAATPTFGEADRAAFLLGQAYLRAGDVARFRGLARSVAAWDHTSVYTGWLAFQALLVETEDGAPRDTTPVALSNPTAVGMTAADILAADLLLRSGDDHGALRLLARADATTSPLGRMIEAAALARAGTDDEALARLAWSDTTTALGRDLAGIAQIRRATRAMRGHQDPRPLLESVPAGSRYASRARHMLGVYELEHDNVPRGLAILHSVLESDSSYADRRAVQLAIAGSSLDNRDFESAHLAYEHTDHDWLAERDTLRYVLETRSFEALWTDWESERPSPDVVSIDALPARLLADRLADSSVDLRSRPANPTIALSVAPHASPHLPVAPPPPEAWRSVTASARAVDESASELERTRSLLARERLALDDRRRYLGLGRERLREEASRLETRAAFLDSLSGSLARIDTLLMSVRDQETQRVLRRTAAILEACENDLRLTRAMRRFYLDGADPGALAPPPAGHAGPDSVLEIEETLTRTMQMAADRLAHEAPALIARSYTEAWRPRLIDRAPRQGLDARRARDWAASLAATLDSSIAATTRSDSLDRLSARLARLTREADSLHAAHAALRERVARAAVDSALAALETEREPIDYGLAVSAYGLAVRLGVDSVSSGHAAAAGVRDSSLDPIGGDPPDDPVTAERRTRAIASLEGFLTKHPRSAARAEMRFRLADLTLIEARQAFRAEMAAYLRDQASGGAHKLRLPALSHARALDLYRAILAEDPGFEHRDAAMFNAGMILADEGDPEAERFFKDLVATHPKSPYCQEAQLRMGDMRFNEKRFLEAVRLYERAATGADPTLRAIAYYKMGWAHYNEDRFAEAADAFRAVLDLYASSDAPRIQADIQGEAESYLVHSLAGAGGAKAASQYFDRIGKRPYEHRVLMALAQNFRRYGEFREAAETDALVLARDPLHSDALSSARRLVETHERAEQAARARAARLELAQRFAPGSDWYRAQTSDSVRSAGAEFARASWMKVAREHHRRARETRSREDWREASRLYSRVIETWPNDPEAPNLELFLGEASASLEDYPAALAHYRAAAASATADSVVAKALWQRVAVTDAWYERERAASRDRKVGPDSLGRAVLDAADEMTKRFPSYSGAADLAWREGQIAYAHGWLDRAIQHFERMANAYPDDRRTPTAISLVAEARFGLADYERAGAAFELALASARRAGRDSLARRAARAIPVCYYRQAEAAVATDSTNYMRHAALFEKVATGWPEYEHAHLAQYRAGLAYLAAGHHREAVHAMETLIERFPRSEYVKDAHLQIAKAWEAGGDSAQAGDAYVKFATRFPGDETAGAATLKGADLFAAAGKTPRADALRLEYIRQHPEDKETAMQILEELARRDLAGVGPERPISMLLGAMAAPKRKASGAAKASAATTPASHLAAYLKLAKANPKLASTEILAQVRFLQGEEARTSYASARLRQPLPKSIAAKQKLLDTLVVRYRRSLDLGVPAWTHASAFRIGEALAGFGEALQQSDRPADLHGDDLLAYEDVLMRQAQAFFDRAEGVWSDLLRQQGSRVAADAWIEKAQNSLWKRLSNRFLYRPEMQFPLIEAPKPPHDPAESGSRMGATVVPHANSSTASGSERER